MERFEDKVRKSISQNEPLICLGYYLPAINFTKLLKWKKFAQPVYIDYMIFYKKADFLALPSLGRDIKVGIIDYIIKVVGGALTLVCLQLLWEGSLRENTPASCSGIYHYKVSKNLSIDNLVQCRILTTKISVFHLEWEGICQPTSYYHVLSVSNIFST